jgi:hypothetical protein
LINEKYEEIAVFQCNFFDENKKKSSLSASNHAERELFFLI